MLMFTNRVLIAFAIVMSTMPALSEQNRRPEQKSMTTRAKCAIMESRGRAAQAKLNRGYVPTEQDQIRAQNLVNWYVTNCI